MGGNESRPCLLLIAKNCLVAPDLALLQLHAHQFCDQRPVLPGITPDADSVQPFQGMEVAFIERKFLVEEDLAYKIAITAANNVRIILAHGG